jgi:hypothetical protein
MTKRVVTRQTLVFDGDDTLWESNHACCAIPYTVPTSREIPIPTGFSGLLKAMAAGG